MRVLMTNDDGVFAPGIRTLAKIFSDAGHGVVLCAPDRERSAASHGVTLGASLHARPVEAEGAVSAWAVDGTPADCASLGLFLTRDDPVDLVVAGINRGMNLGGACVYSGTVGAALEAAMCSVQALAVSLCVRHDAPDADYAPAARLALRVAEWMRGHPLPLGAIYNLNVPALPFQRLRGLVAATLAPVFLDPPEYEAAQDAEGVAYRYCSPPDRRFAPETDLEKVNAGYATLTKLTWDFRMNADDDELNHIGL